MMRPLRPILCLATAAALWCSTRASFAAPSTADVAAAQQCFDDGVTLYRDEKYELACAKFAQSQALDPKLGTLLNLALCHEKAGHLAEATTEFRDARTLALARHDAEKAGFAEQHIAALEPSLARLSILSAASSENPARISLDGVPLNLAAIDAEIRVDPGKHHVEASTDGAPVFVIDVVCAASESCRVELPSFTKPPIIAPPPPPKLAPLQHTHAGRWAGVAVLVGATAFTLAGGIFGGLAFVQRNKAEALCAAKACDEGRRADDLALGFAWTSNVAFGVAAVALVVGVVLVLVDPGARVVHPTQGASGVAFDF